jgi:hypothetical protein
MNKLILAIPVMSAVGVFIVCALASTAVSANGLLDKPTFGDKFKPGPRTPKSFATQQGEGNIPGRRPIVFDHSGLITQGMGSPTGIDAVTAERPRSTRARQYP